MLRDFLSIPISIIRGLRDLAASIRPILRRELVGFLRSPKAFWIAAATVGGASLIPLLYWPESGREQPFLKAREAFRAYGWTFAAALFLFVPAVTAASITAERERGTYEALYTTLIRPSGIVLGKLAAAAAYFLILLALTFPMALVIILLGGFAWWEFALVAVLLSLFTLFLGLVGLWASIRNRRTPRAIIEAFGALTVGLLISVMCAGLFALPILFVIVVAMLFHQARYPGPGPSAQEEAAAIRSPAWRPSPLPERTWLTGKLLARTRAGIPDDWNPVFAASVRSDIVGSAGFRRAVFWGPLVLVTIPSCVFGHSFEARPSAALSFATVALLWAMALVLPGAAASIIAGERDLGNLELLRGTALTAREVFRGKLLAALFGALGIAAVGAITCAAFLPGLAIEGGGAWMIAPCFLAAAAAVVLWSISSGFLAAVITRTAVSALAVSYAIAMGFLLGIPGFLDLLQQSVWMGPAGPPSVSPLLWYTGLSIHSGRGLDAGAIGMALPIALPLALAAAQYALAAAIFARRWMREA